ncbi:MAG: 30S ribosomal protein S13 [Candidatus Woesearchaeota archaeon]
MVEFRHIVRVMNTDIKGEKQLYLALQKIKGVGDMFAQATCKLAGLDVSMKAGDLTDKDVEKLEKVLKNPISAGMPNYFLNRQKDYETGEDMHIYLADLDFIKDGDIKRQKMIKSNKGLRHQWRLPVRGQRTRSNFRPNKGKSTAVKKKTTVRK